jgi:hypothetical protein
LEANRLCLLGLLFDSDVPSRRHGVMSQKVTPPNYRVENTRLCIVLESVGVFEYCLVPAKDEYNGHLTQLHRDSIATLVYRKENTSTICLALLQALRRSTQVDGCAMIITL